MRAGRYERKTAGTEGWVRSELTGIDLRAGKPGKLAMRLEGDDMIREELPED